MAQTPFFNAERIHAFQMQSTVIAFGRDPVWKTLATI
jgi:hypothetical protein